MRAPDLPWAETNPDHGEGSDRLAARLMRLAAGHPSADVAGYPNEDHQDSVDLEPDAVDLEPELVDLEPDPVDPGEPGDEPPAAHSRARGGAEPATLDAFGGEDRGPYRPWFSADGASDPWFAAPRDQS